MLRLFILMDRYLEAPGKCLFPFKYVNVLVIKRKNKYVLESRNHDLPRFKSVLNC